LFSKEEIATAIKVINEVAGAPSVGAIADLIKEIEKASTPAKDVRTVEPKETR
jgi:hypothetical protein